MPPPCKPQYCISLRIDKQILHNSVDESEEAAEFYLVTKLLDRCVGRVRVQSEVTAPPAAPPSDSSVSAVPNSPSKQPHNVNAAPNRPAKKSNSVSRSRSRSITKNAARNSAPATPGSKSTSFKNTKSSPPQRTPSSSSKNVPRRRAQPQSNNRGNKLPSSSCKHGTLTQTLSAIEQRSRTRGKRSRAKAANVYADKKLKQIKRGGGGNRTVPPSDVIALSDPTNGDETMKEAEFEQTQGSGKEEDIVEITDREDDCSNEVIDPVDLQTWKLVTGRPKRQSIVPKRFEHAPKRRKLNLSTLGGSSSHTGGTKAKQDDGIAAEKSERGAEMNEAIEGSNSNVDGDNNEAVLPTPTEDTVAALDAEVAANEQLEESIASSVVEVLTELKQETIENKESQQGNIFETLNESFSPEQQQPMRFKASKKKEQKAEKLTDSKKQVKATGRKKEPRIERNGVGRFVSSSPLKASAKEPLGAAPRQSACAENDGKGGITVISALPRDDNPEVNKEMVAVEQLNSMDQCNTNLTATVTVNSVSSSKVVAAAAATPSLVQDAQVDAVLTSQASMTSPADRLPVSVAACASPPVDSPRRCFLCFDSGLQLLSCAKCPRVFHPNCLIPPLKHMPLGDWFCRICCKGTRIPSHS